VVVDACLQAFHSWGYGMVATPMLEPLDTVAAGVGAERQNQLFRFMDADGSLLALVGERTVSVARVVATQLRDAPLPLRLCYAGPVVRNQPLLGGRRRETQQAGCELIGRRDLDADAECVALAARALAAAGLPDVQIDVGHADFFPALLEGSGLAPEDQQRVLTALSERDLVAVERVLEETPLRSAERALLLGFPALRGGRELLDVAAAGLRASRVLKVLDDLGRLWSLLEAHGVIGSVALDLGAVPDWDYYTGPTFELFSGGLGFPLGSGGRYDTLLRRFGVDLPATGFVLQVDRCHDAVERATPPAELAAPVRIAYGQDQAAQAITVAGRLRAAGLAASCDLFVDDGPGIPDPRVLVEQSGIRWLEGGRWRPGTLDEAIQALTENR